ncbi:hypothetical protein NQ317_013456, partial [Molorchus minor]
GDSLGLIPLGTSSRIIGTTPRYFFSKSLLRESPGVLYPVGSLYRRKKGTEGSPPHKGSLEHHNLYRAISTRRHAKTTNRYWVSQTIVKISMSDIVLDMSRKNELSYELTVKSIATGLVKKCRRLSQALQLEKKWR